MPMRSVSSTRMTRTAERRKHDDLVHCGTCGNRRIFGLARRGGRGLHDRARRRDIARLAPAAFGTTAGLAVLAGIVLLLGPLLDRVPITSLQLAIGILLLLFGMGWLRKASLRAAGVIPLHDEDAIFAAETAELGRAKRDRRQRNLDWVAGITALKAVLLEGLEVVFIVIAVGAGRGLLMPASLGALAACALVLVDRRRRSPAAVARAGEYSQIRRWRYVVGFRRVLDRRRARHRLARAGFGAAACSPPCSWLRGWSALSLPEAQRGVRMMTMLKELAAELIGMFVAEKWLTLTVLALVAVAGWLVDFTGLDPLRRRRRPAVRVA